VKALGQRDLLGILEFINGASSVSGPHTFGAYVTSELPRLIPATLAAYAELDLAKRSVHWTTDRPDADFPNAARVLAAHIPDNPFIVYRKRTGDEGAVRLSDITTEREFRNTGLYREFYRPLRVKHSMACALRLSQQELFAVALYRDGLDFSARDRICLELLRPHLAHLQRSVELMSRTRRDLALLTKGVEVWAQGYVIVDGAGRIRRGTASAEQWLTRYFEPAPRAGRLPERLWDWVRSNGAARGRTDTLPPVRRPLVIERQGRRMTVRLVSQPPDTVLLLEETATRLNPAVLTRLGLSSRESEVLAWAASGKTNPAIADLLRISSRTVQTHLERIYRKLGVETRTAAAARALEAMREADPGERVSP
jgi:DNA-binding CsgD family transcriptional regulator